MWGWLLRMSDTHTKGKAGIARVFIAEGTHILPAEEGGCFVEELSVSNDRCDLREYILAFMLLKCIYQNLDLMQTSPRQRRFTYQARKLFFWRRGLFLKR